jgi:Sec-independent protein translocase protein TatA
MEALMNRATYLVDSDTLKVEHVFTLNFSDKWDKPFRRAVHSWVELSFHFAESFRFIAIGISAYFVLLGASKLIESAKSGKSSTGNHKSRSSTKDEASATKEKSSSREKSKTSKPSSPKSESKEDTPKTTDSKDATKTETKE